MDSNENKLASLYNLLKSTEELNSFRVPFPSEESSEIQRWILNELELILNQQQQDEEEQSIQLPNRPNPLGLILDWNLHLHPELVCPPLPLSLTPPPLQSSPHHSSPSQQPPLPSPRKPSPPLLSSPMPLPRWDFPSPPPYSPSSPLSPLSWSSPLVANFPCYFYFGGDEIQSDEISSTTDDSEPPSSD